MDGESPGWVQRVTIVLDVAAPPQLTLEGFPNAK